MFASRRQLRRVTWLAFIAMAALALLPTVARALAHASGHYAAICTATGARLVALDQDEQQQAPAGAAAHFEPCPFCASACGGLPMPPAPPAVHLLPLLGSTPPPLFLHAPRTLYAWVTAQPRAPPR